MPPIQDRQCQQQPSKQSPSSPHQPRRQTAGERPDHRAPRFHAPVQRCNLPAASPTPASQQQRTYHRDKVDRAQHPPAAIAGRPSAHDAATLGPTQYQRSQKAARDRPCNRAQPRPQRIDHSVPSTFSTRAPLVPAKPTFASASPSAASAVSTRISAT